MSENKKVKFQFVGTFEVPDEKIIIKFDHQGKTLDEFRDLVGTMISIDHSQYHNGTVAAEDNQVSVEFKEGMDAFKLGKSRHYNPYRNKGTDFSTQLGDWDNGWGFAEKQRSFSEHQMDAFNDRNTLFQAMDYLRSIEDGRDGNCSIDNSGFCQRHMAYVNEGDNECLFKNIANFVDQFDEKLTQQGIEK